MRQNDGRMRLIGITGGIGAGKSEILAYIKKHYKCRIYLADEVAHLVTEPGQKCYERLVALLGSSVLMEDKTIDRKRMAARIFTDAALLARVNETIHPAVKEYLLEAVSRARAEQEAELFFIEAALLIETGYKDIVDELWYIYASSGTREQRLMDSRGYSQEKITEIMAKQLAEETFRRECDFIIDNSTTLEEAYRQIDKRLEAYTWLD